ncbi:hypothetical protein CMI37_16980 [Candidatus Pacearchaeota archaeon]|nr:hypothetical protein [Candidatus Pacearchaeota archaeon]|tara:strand:- start:34 stop:735 length:702 start_codon:yes stop_codon:yes gene_type:complete
MPELMLCTSSRIHPKIRRLKNKLGAEGVLALYNLWCFCKEYRKDGHLTGMEDQDISEAADYEGDNETFVQVLVDLRLLDANGGVFAVHGWNKYNLVKPKKQSGAKALPSVKAPESLGGKYTPVEEVVSYYRTVHPTRGKMIVPGHSDWKKVRKRLKEGYSVDDLKKAIDGNKLCPWHQKVPAGHSIEFIFRNTSKIEGFIERASDPEQYNEVTQIGHHKGSEDFGDGDQAARF